MDPKIVYQNERLLVVDKPAGWVTNSSSTTENVPVVQNWLCENFDYALANNPEYRSGIVHRLDKDTSGILLVAKTKKYFEFLQDQFKLRKVVKKYAALLHGKLEPKAGNVSASVGRLPWNRERFGVLAGGRDAETKYSVLGYFRGEKEIYSLVEFSPKTGRTHQLRIHAKHIGHPIVSDTFYAGRKTARNDKKWCPRLFLHAGYIKFIDSNAKKEFESELPDDLVNSLKNLTQL